MLKSYKYRIYPNKQQEELLIKQFNGCRFVYNLALETKILVYKMRGINMSDYDLIKQITQLKKDAVWLKEIDIESLQQSVINMGFAYRHFFKGKSGFPRFKKKNQRQSFRILTLIKVNFEKSIITIGKHKNISVVLDRKFIGTIKSATVSKSISGKYFASILIETGIDKVEPKQVSRAIGIDLGLSSFMITSEGEKIDNPRYLRASIERLKVLQRRAAKKKRGSANRQKFNNKIAVLHERISNQRLDFLHKLSTKIVHDNQVDTICLEDLGVKNMIKNHSLAQAISDVSWGKFVEILKYKCDWYGKNLILVDRFYPSSKTCSCCGAINKDLKLSDREWFCVCGAEHDRDINAAINIKNSGLGKSGEPVESLTIVRAKKQETKIYNSERKTSLKKIKL